MATTCPECGSVLKNEKECPNCGYPITSTAPSDNCLTPCSDCGHMIASDATECPQCGGHILSKKSKGTLRILMKGEGRYNMETAPVYINGQMIEAVELSNGCDIVVPINNPNINVGYQAPLTYVEHTYKLNTEKDYYLVITNGADLGFTLFDSRDKKLSEDKLNVAWLIYSILFGVFAILVSFKETNSKPILSKCLRIYGLLVISFFLLGLPLAFVMGDNKPKVQ